MRRLTTVSICAAALLASACGEGRQSRGGRQLHMAWTPKGAEVDWLTRMATADGRIVVSDREIPAGSRAVSVTAGADEQVLVAELMTGGEPTLPYEVARIDRHALLVAPADVDAVEAVHELALVVEPVRTEPLARDLRARSAAPALARLLPDTDHPVGLKDIDQARLEDHLARFSGAKPAMIGDSEVTIRERGSASGKALARAYLRQEYEALGFVVTEVAYGRGEGEATGTNLVAERQGQNRDQWLLVTSHYDSVGNAGADDDGAGTVSALEVARSLQAVDLTLGLRIVAFDEEERGLVGSAAYTRALSAQGTIGQVAGVLNLEMTGYDSDGDGAFHAIDCNENTSASLTAAVVRSVAAQGLALRHVPACTNRSDHASFWRYDRPAIVVSENFFGGDGNPCYHRACDQVGQLDFNYMAKVTAAVAGAAAALAGAP